jgi:hypothetical protein
LIGECFWLIVTTEEWNMRQTTETRTNPVEKIVKDIKRATRNRPPAPETIIPIDQGHALTFKLDQSVGAGQNFKNCL